MIRANDDLALRRPLMFELAYWFYSVGANPILCEATLRPLWYRAIHAPDRLSANGTTSRFAGRRVVCAGIRQRLHPSTSDIHP